MPESALLADRRTSGLPPPAEVITVTLGDKEFEAGRRTAAHIEATIEALAIQHPDAHFHVMQSCYHQGYAPSKYTHDFDAVIDVRIDGLDWWVAQRFMREQGWASWYRHTGEWSAVDAWHLHSVSIGCPGPVGIYVPAQVDDYYRHSLGLKGQHNSGLDHSWFPADISLTVFDYPGFVAAKEDSMPYTDWPKADREALVKDVSAAVVKGLLDAEPDGGQLKVGALLKRAANATDRVKQLARDLGKPQK